MGRYSRATGQLGVGWYRRQFPQRSLRRTGRIMAVRAIRTITVNDDLIHYLAVGLAISVKEVVDGAELGTRRHDGMARNGKIVLIVLCWSVEA